jgi:hypothetical protein
MPRVLLPSNEVHVWRIFLDDAATLALCRESWLTPEEKRRADSFRFSRDSGRCVVSAYPGPSRRVCRHGGH